jgi:hypothetical protein
MKFILSFLAIMLCALQNICAQNALLNTPHLLNEHMKKSSNLKLIELAPFPKKPGSDVISIDDRPFHNFNFIEIPTALIKSSKLNREADGQIGEHFTIPFFEPINVFTREDIMRLPAVNTNDIIKILDRDRLLTNW